MAPRWVPPSNNYVSPQGAITPQQFWSTPMQHPSMISGLPRHPHWIHSHYCFNQHAINPLQISQQLIHNAYFGLQYPLLSKPRPKANNFTHTTSHPMMTNVITPFNDPTKQYASCHPKGPSALPSMPSTMSSTWRSIIHPVTPSPETQQLIKQDLT